MNFLSVVGQGSRLMQFGSLTLDLDDRVVRRGGVIVPASPAEFEVLQCLVTHRSLPMSKECLAQAVFGANHGRDLRQIDVFVARLRRSLTDVGLPHLIATIAGRGYAVLDDGAALETDVRPIETNREILAA